MKYVGNFAKIWGKYLRKRNNATEKVQQCSKITTGFNAAGTEWRLQTV